jgi:hypothetical protein
MKEETQLTAVEWVLDWMDKNQYFIGNDLLKAVEEAKEMEKEQIKDAYLNGKYEADKIVMGHSFYAEQYYNETFKQQEQ